MSYYHASVLLVSFFYHMKVYIVLDDGVEPHGCGGGGEPGSARQGSPIFHKMFSPTSNL